METLVYYSEGVPFKKVDALELATTIFDNKKRTHLNKTDPTKQEKDAKAKRKNRRHLRQRQVSSPFDAAVSP